ncbi:peptidase M24, structural domain-containing protein [Microdochium trichocladiopsis]|uniref:Probable Xaa-Pro aminopeptidase P n=1 Tax=Microdochium trichocladiopsis TaxID=1682393 RepID=A0A9P8YIC4_9PEZI|nr:peptidase M24, structural domain-containing protein [Microdochium trichocladiopsis]KAH7039826.1 peptidase M24, structural domain-containing protein [Microdochium trichocladiopsis]
MHTTDRPLRAPGADIEAKPLLGAFLDRPTAPAPRAALANRSWLLRALTVTGLLVVAAAITFITTSDTTASLGTSIEECAWAALEEHVSLLDVPPIPRSEFLARQQRLAAALKAEGVDAFIAEPSASTAYYANVSAAFDLSERPFLVILDSRAEFSYLVPSFEAGRIAALDMVYDTKAVIQWDETQSPYAVLKDKTKLGRVMVDEHARFMIAAGLGGAGIEVVPMSATVQKLRAVKQESEIAILRGINRFTRQLVRALRPCIRVGMTQEEVTQAAKALFTRAGVGEGFWAIILFGDQAAFPHGGKHGKTLQHGEFVLIDIGSSLHSYGSDVTRTVLPPSATVSKELLDMWHTVHAAQSAGFELMHPNQTCSDIDAASRKPVEAAGLGPYYTHRLGHGLGLEMHEHPYLNGANKEKLSIGEVATNEPGIYVTTEQASEIGWKTGFGIRLEDPILVTKDGGEPLTGRRALSPYDP